MTITKPATDSTTIWPTGDAAADAHALAVAYHKVACKFGTASSFSMCRFRVPHERTVAAILDLLHGAPLPPVGQNMRTILSQPVRTPAPKMVEYHQPRAANGEVVAGRRFYVRGRAQRGAGGATPTGPSPALWHIERSGDSTVARCGVGLPLRGATSARPRGSICPACSATTTVQSVVSA